MQNIKIIVEKHSDGYVAYPIGIEGVVIGEGESLRRSLVRYKISYPFSC